MIFLTFWNNISRDYISLSCDKKKDITIIYIIFYCCFLKSGLGKIFNRVLFQNLSPNSSSVGLIRIPKLFHRQFYNRSLSSHNCDCDLLKAFKGNCRQLNCPVHPQTLCSCVETCSVSDTKYTIYSRLIVNLLLFSNFTWFPIYPVYISLIVVTNLIKCL